VVSRPGSNGHRALETLAYPARTEREGKKEGGKGPAAKSASPPWFFDAKNGCFLMPSTTKQCTEGKKGKKKGGKRATIVAISEIIVGRK